MIEDKTLVWKFNRGSRDALQRIYEKFKNDLVGLAMTLLRDRSLAEDVVHDVFVAFARKAGQFSLSGTLKGGHEGDMRGQDSRQGCDPAGA
jgi:DNA-directed RNA polymerase specialized sigma24 family protein